MFYPISDAYTLKNTKVLLRKNSIEKESLNFIQEYHRNVSQRSWLEDEKQGWVCLMEDSIRNWTYNLIGVAMVYLQSI